MQTTSRYASRTSASLGKGYSFIALRFGTCTRFMSWRKTSNTRKHHPRKWRQNERLKLTPILKYLETYMLDIHKQYTPGEAMEKALRYAFAVWIRIGRYVQDGRFNIDNNLMEQAIRPITLGRKNYLFCGNNEGAENNAIFYTFVAYCREADIDPYKWMKAGSINYHRT
ncbi:transposase [Prevotella melaninogenica]